VDDDTDPWRTPGAILLSHGNAERSAARSAWVPWLAQRYRVVRPDMRGFGESMPMTREFPWTLDVLIEAFKRQDIGPWARESIASRLSSTFPPEGVA
jgi:pimeloyl-ACP methyl ester carboxylesterase